MWIMTTAERLADMAAGASAMRASVNHYQGTYYFTLQGAQVVAGKAATVRKERRGFVVVHPDGRVLGPEGWR